MLIPIETKKTYWGGVDFVRAPTGLALKQIYMKAGTQSSMEYHVVKDEIYWLTYGTLNLKIRDGRGVNRIVTLNEGGCFFIQRGMMHQRIAVTDLCIMEACSCDSDEDTHIVFDGNLKEDV